MMAATDAIATAAPYDTGREYLHDELARLNVRLARFARRRACARPTGADGRADEDLRDADELIRRIDHHVGLRLAASYRNLIDLPLAALSRLYQLTAFETETVLVCLAPEVDRRYEDLYGFLQDDISQQKPTVGLVLALLCTDEERLTARRSFDPQAPLIRYRLCRLNESSVPGSCPLESRTLTLAPRIAQFLL